MSDHSACQFFLDNNSIYFIQNIVGIYKKLCIFAYSKKNIMNELIQALEQQRVAKGYTKYRLAKLADIPYQTIMNVMNGKNARIATIMRLCDVLSLKISVTAKGD